LFTKADGMATECNLEAANVVNKYYVEKVLKIRAGMIVQNTTPKDAATPRDGDTGGEGGGGIPSLSALLTRAESRKSSPG
jgi:hypothetical protein